MESSYSPSREDADQRPDENPALPANLLAQVLSNTNIQRAWKQVRRNKGAPGVDGISIDQFTDWVRPQWHDLKEQLFTGSYYPQPVKRVRIPKGR